jgi:hypothetical protein
MDQILNCASSRENDRSTSVINIKAIKLRSVIVRDCMGRKSAIVLIESSIEVNVGSKVSTTALILVNVCISSVLV